MAQITKERAEVVKDAEIVEDVEGERKDARAIRWPWGWLASLAVMGALGAYHWLLYTPRPDIPHRLAILDLLFRVGVAAAIVWLGALMGLRALRSLRITAALSRVEHLALGAGLGLGALSLLTLALGLAHLYYTPTFVALLAVGPLFFPAERRWLSDRASELWTAARALPRHRAIRFETLACLPLGAIALSVLLLSYVRDLTLPEGGQGYDTYQYHWAVPSLLLRAHVWHGFPGWAHANLPFNTEMLNLIALSLRAPTAANIVQDTFAALFALLVFGLVRRHFGPVVAWLALASLVTVQLLLAFASQSYVETALLFYGFAALSLLIIWLERRWGTSRAGIEAVGLAGVALGFALGVKYTAIEYAPGLALLLVTGCLALLGRERGTVGRRARVVQIARLLGVFAGGVALAIAPWFVKNLIYLGNPVYPALGSVFPDPVWNATRDQTLTSTFQHFGPHTGVVARFHLYAFDLFIHPEHYREGRTSYTGRFALAAALAIPALLVGAWRGWWSGDERRRGQMLVLAGLAVVTSFGLIVWTLSGALVERYALPPVVLATVLGATLIGWLVTALVELPTTYHAVNLLRPAQVISLILLATVMVFCVGHERTDLYKTVRLARNPLPILTGSLSEDQYRDKRLGASMSGDFWKLVDYVNTQLPHNGKLLMLERGSGYFFTNRDYVADSGGDWVPYLVSAGKTPQGMLALLHAQGYTYVVYDAWYMSWLQNVYQNRVLQSDGPVYLAFQQAYLIPIASWGNLSLYRVPDVSNG